MSAHEVHAPRVKDPDTMRPCTVQKVYRNPCGIRYMMVLEDPDTDGTARRQAQKVAYPVAVGSLWYIS